MTETKTCPKCGEEKGIGAFAKRRRRGKVTTQAWCRPCQKVYKDAHYQRNKEDYRAKAKAWRRRVEDRIKALKESTPCADCGASYPCYVMDFDHRDPDEKVMTISEMIHAGFGEAKMNAEIEKCDVVCSNCHRERTWGELQRFKARSSMG